MADTLHLYKPKALHNGVIAEDLGTECVVYDKSRKKAHLLNPTLSWIWRHCDGSRTVDDLARQLSQETGSDDAGRILIAGLKQLANAHLLESELDESHLTAPAMSRRAMVAGASVVAPMITSILAPTPAAARSKPDKVDNQTKKDKDNKGRRVSVGNVLRRNLKP